MLRLRNVAFGYEGKKVLSGIELTLERCEFVGIVGPNGAGKTTLVRGLLGLIAPLEGNLECEPGELGYVPQQERLDPLFPLRVDEVVRMGAFARLSGLRRVRREDRRLTEAALERVGMAQHRSKPFAALSGGQRQRVLIARALVTRPVVLLLDEPTSGVDRDARAQILSLLQDLNAREALTILIVSHDLPFLRDSTRDVLWVEDGCVARRPVSALSDRAATPLGETESPS